jgi:dihydroxyacetone kinase-like predicted kinase
MLWAEETYGIGTGSEKWTEAWNKLTELLQVQGIKLTNKEMAIVSTQMKANIPEINSLVYSALPEISTVTRAPDLKPTEMSKLVDKLREKYPTQEE